MVVWKVPAQVPGSTHDFKYRLLKEGILEQDDDGKISCSFSVIHFDFELKKEVA